MSDKLGERDWPLAPDRGAPASPRFDADFRAELETLFRWRRDVRRFKSLPLPVGFLDDLMRIASLAPSVGLSQPWRFVTVDDPTRRARVREIFTACNRAAIDAQTADRAQLYARLKLEGLDEAPCHLAVFAEASPSQGHGLGRATMPEMTLYSAVIAIHTMWLAARAAGIGLGWVSILDPTDVAKALDVPPAWTLVGYVCIGYPRQDTDMPELERAGWEQRCLEAGLAMRR